MISVQQCGRKRRPSLNNVVVGDKKLPLAGAVICLTGLPLVEKEHLHALIEELGGTFTRDLNSARNTHLIANTLEGPKCEAALEFEHIHIVKPTWLTACSEQNRLVEERQFCLRTDEKQHELPADSLLDAVNERVGGKNGVEISWLFSGCHFFMVGFEDDDALCLSVGKLIRRAMGTIHWELHNDVSYVIVNDQSGIEIREAALRLESLPHLVSPWWIIASWDKQKRAQCSAYPPTYRKKPPPNKIARKAKRSTKFSRSRVPSIFRGNLFVMVRVAPPDWAVDFSQEELENLVVSHGGSLLSLKLVEALRTDKTAGRLEKTQLRRCFVVCWGSCKPGDLMHPLVAQVRRHELCELREVTPVWLRTCAAEQKCLSPCELPQVFVPNHRPLCRALRVVVNTDDGSTKGGNAAKKKEGESTDMMSMRISVTGFSGSKRTALIQLVQAMGGVYEDSMRTSTTHLICRRAAGDKYNKASEWKIHTVREDWLYHIAIYGFSGKDKSDGEGCENKFLCKADGTTAN